MDGAGRYQSIDYFCGIQTVKNIFVRQDERYFHTWAIPFGESDCILEAAYHAHWKGVPKEERRRGGLMGLCEPGPGELNHVVVDFARKYRNPKPLIGVN